MVALNLKRYVGKMWWAKFRVKYHLNYFQCYVILFEVISNFINYSFINQLGSKFCVIFPAILKLLMLKYQKLNVASIHSECPRMLQCPTFLEERWDRVDWPNNSTNLVPKLSEPRNDEKNQTIVSKRRSRQKEDRGESRSEVARKSKRRWWTRGRRQGRKRGKKGTEGRGERVRGRRKFN